MPVTSACTELVTVPTRGLPESSLPPVHRGAEMRGQEPSSSRKSLPAGRQGQGSGPSAALSPCSGKLVKAPSKRFVFLLPFLDSHPSAPNSASHIHYRKKKLSFLNCGKIHMCCAVFSRSVVSDSLWAHGLQPARLLCPWGFSRQECWSGLPCPPPGDLPRPGVEPRSPAWQEDSLPVEPPRKPQNTHNSSHFTITGNHFLSAQFSGNRHTHIIV